MFYDKTRTFVPCKKEIDMEKDEKKNEVRNGNSIGSSRWDDVIFRL